MNRCLAVVVACVLFLTGFARAGLDVETFRRTSPRSFPLSTGSTAQFTLTIDARFTVDEKLQQPTVRFPARVRRPSRSPSSTSKYPLILDLATPTARLSPGHQGSSSAKGRSPVTTR